MTGPAVPIPFASDTLAGRPSDDARDESFEARWHRWQVKGRASDLRTGKLMRIWGAVGGAAIVTWFVWRALG